MSDYTPNEEQVREQYTQEQPPQIGTVAEKRDEFDRFLAKVKADALREAAEATRGEAPGEPWAGALFSSYAEWLDDRADRIERGER